MLTAIKTEREQNEELKATNLNMLVRQEKDAPKVELAEAISEPDGSVLIRDFEKLLRSRGYQIENNGLYKWMRDENLIKPQYPNQHGGWSYIAPKKALKDGLMYNRRGKTGGLMAPVITPKGQDYILDNIGGFANQQTKVTAPAESASAMSILKLQGKLNRDGLKVAGYQGQWLFEFLKAKKLIKACGHKGKASVYSATPAAVKNGWFVNMRNKSGYISSTAVTPSGVEHITSLVKAEG